MWSQIAPLTEAQAATAAAVSVGAAVRAAKASKSKTGSGGGSSSGGSGGGSKNSRMVGSDLANMRRKQKRMKKKAFRSSYRLR